MRAAKITMLILTIISFCLFQVMNRMTVSPTTSSGNGNPALFFGMILVPIFVLMFLLWLRILRVHAVQMKATIIGLVVTSIHLIISFLYQRNALDHYREFVKSELLKKYKSVDVQYVESITSFLSIHINNQYFNINTFFMFLSFSLLLAFAYYLWDLFDAKKIQQATISK